LKIPDRVIEEIRERLDLVELVGGYVQLKRSGKNFVGLCPFHQEKTPSFNVSPERNIWHCFGCQETGDAYRFLMEHDHLSFPEAVRALAQRVGVDLSPYEGGGRGTDEFDQLYQAHELAERLYRKVLGTDEGKAARDEIARRGLSREVVDEYRLGASPAGWDRLVGLAAREGLRASILEKGGLAIRRDSGGHYDRFRGRLMFPIHAPGGRPIGFGGRVLDGTEPKYLNSPETPLFRKRKTLYGIPQATAALRESRHAILVEGYTDVLGLATHGIRGALAALGTAFTADHAAWLKRSCDKVTVVFDGDDAGRKAAESSVGPLLGAGLEVALVMLPAGEDPDTLLRSEGPEAMARRLEEGGNPIDVLLGDEAYEGGPARERAVRRVLEALAPVADPIRRRVLLQEVSIRVGVPAAMLEEQLADLRRKVAAAEKRIAERERVREKQPARGGGKKAGGRGVEPAAKVKSEVAPPEPGPEGPETDPFEESGELPELIRAADLVSGPPPVLEVTLLGIVLHDETQGEGLLERFGPADFEHPLTRRVAETACGIMSSGRPVTAAALLEAFRMDAPARELVGRLAMAVNHAVDPARTAADVAVSMERRGMQREMARVDAELRKAKAKGDQAELTELARRKSDLARRIARLSSPHGLIR
jgi:DNA primase